MVRPVLFAIVSLHIQIEPLAFSNVVGYAPYVGVRAERPDSLLEQGARSPVRITPSEVRK